MANKKISQLTQANLPLVGTEELPIVQGGQTVKVSVQDIVGSSGVTEVTYTALQSLIASSSLVPGSTYKITGFNKNMPEGSPENPNGYLPVVLYDDGTNSGITIYLQAVTNNTLSESGHGEFYNPKYIYIYDEPFNPLTVSSRPYVTFRDSYNGRVGENILDGEFTILHSTDSGNYYLINFTAWTQGGAGGGFSYTRQLITPTMDEPIISFTKADYGSEVDVIEPGVLEITRGSNGVIYNAALESSAVPNDSPLGTEWSRNGMPTYNSTNGTGLYGIWDGDNPDPLEIPAYQVDQVVFWGGYAWKNLTGNVGTFLNVLDLDPTDWEKLPYTDTNHYEKVIDEIKVDLNNSILIGRTNVENQITVEFNADQYWWWMGIYWNIQYNPISVMGWGLYSKVTPEQFAGEFYGISNLHIINSNCETVNFKGEALLNLNMESSYFYNNYIGRGCYLYHIIMFNNSNINNNILTNGSEINNGELDSSNIGGNFISSDSYVQSNRLINSSINNNTLINSYISLNLCTGSNINNNTLNNGSNIYDNVLNGNSNFNNNTLNNSSILQYNQLVNSYINNNELDNSDIVSNILSNISYISQNSITGSSISGNRLYSASKIEINNLTDSSNIGSCEMTSSWISNNTLPSQTSIANCVMNIGFLNLSTTGPIPNSIQNLTIENTSIIENLSSATAIFLNTSKRVFTRVDGVKRLMYYNNSDTPTIVNVNA